MSNAIIDQLMPLGLMTAGQAAHVEHVQGDRDHVQRLSELGLRSGSPVEMVKPGSPCIIRLGRQRLCFRADELTSVLVRTGKSA
jgi:ferrous iron transport protein A